ncbi:MAG: ATP-binding protein, partial [Stackebrandtia sp.]
PGRPPGGVRHRRRMGGPTNAPFGRWGEVFGDDVVAAAMIDRLVHHADVVALKGDSYRLKDRDLGRVPAATTEEP